MKTKINLAYSWNSVSKDTIINCFKKAGIGNSSKKLAVTETDGSFKVLIEETTISFLLAEHFRGHELYVLLKMSQNFLRFPKKINSFCS